MEGGSDLELSEDEEERNDIQDEAEISEEEQEKENDRGHEEEPILG